MKKILSVFILLTSLSALSAQTNSSYELSANLAFQKTHKLYWENGVSADFALSQILDKKLHLKATILSSRLGSALNSNAIRQELYLIGADWRFLSQRPIQIFTGLNTGFFSADYESPIFDSLSSKSPLLQFESGLIWKNSSPIQLSASIGYNFISGNGVKGSGTLFPLLYGIKAGYRIK